MCKCYYGFIVRILHVFFIKGRFPTRNNQNTTTLKIGATNIEIISQSFNLTKIFYQIWNNVAILIYVIQICFIVSSIYALVTVSFVF